MQEISRARNSAAETATLQITDWPVTSPSEYTANAVNFTNGSAQFVSVVAVENNEPVEKPYVTVVSVDGDNESSEEEVLVYRLPGERLGFGLKFDGGIRNADKVARLYIQSCAGDSPASRTHASWGPLGPGDEIVSIDDVRVDTMTRTDCVRALKESAVVIRLTVRRRSDPSIPPPIPPRKCLRRRQSDSQVPQPVQQTELTKTRSCGIAQAEVYTDLFSMENTVPTESESDDTSSSLSTVVSRVSSTANSSFSDARSINSVDISPPTTVKATTPFDLDKVLEPFLQLERELSSSTLDSGSLFTCLVEASSLLDNNSPPSSGGEVVPRPVPRMSCKELSISPQPSTEIPSRSELSRPVCPPRPCHQAPPPPPPPPPLPPLQQLPRLIDFVPKDRTDVLAPSPIHPPDKTAADGKPKTKDESSDTAECPGKTSPLGSLEKSKLLTNYYSGGVGEPQQLRLSPDGRELMEDMVTSQPLVTIQSIRTKSGSCNDERSEKSVRDKIAMFSEQMIATQTTSTNPQNGRKIIQREIVRPNKAPPSPPLKRDRPSTTTKTTTPKLAEQRKLKSTVDLRTLEFGCCQQSVDNVSTTLPRTERTGMTGTGLTRAVSFTSGTKLHSRSQSLVDVGTRTSLIKDDSRRLSTMIEQRKRCMSKLRGLVIPEKVAEVPHFVDLPEIKSRDCTLPESSPDKEQTESVDVQSCTMSNATVVNKLPSSPLICSPPWKSADSNLPKYSPAFKRKSLTIYDAHYQPSNGVNTAWFGTDLTQETKGDQYLDVIPSRLNMKQRPTSPVHTKVIEIRDEESDCDSAVSSSRSDLSHSPTSELSRVSRTLSDDTNTSTEPTLTATSSLITTNRPAQKDRTSLNNDHTKKPKELEEKARLNEQPKIRKMIEDASFSIIINPQDKSLNNIMNNNNNTSEHLTKIPMSYADIQAHDQSKVKSSKHTMQFYKTNNNNNNNNSTNNNNNITSNGLKKHLDKSDSQIKLANSIQHPRVSSIDSTTSDDSLFPTTSMYYNSVTNLQREQQFGSISSLASSTSLISQQELSQLIEEANHTLEESHEVVVVILHRDNPGGSIGITLAGGADYEAKEITVHKVLVGSPAERDGRIQKGDRILSINGKSMKGLTHYESLAILKAPRPEVVLVVSRHKSDPQDDTTPLRCHTNTLRSPRFIEPPKFSSPPSDKENELKWGPIESVTLHKDGAGLGFSLEGGKDSPYGDMPLTIKKIFTGGCAEKSGLVYAGDELLTVNGHDVSGLSRIEAWALMKRLPDGRVTLAIRHPIHSAT